MRILQAAILVVTFLKAHAQDANCDYSQNVQVGQTYYVYSPNYPNNYPAGVQCRWIGICPSGYNCRLDCDNINLPQSPNCSMDRLLISKTGDPQLNSADYYCGAGSLTAVSTGQRISVGLISSLYSPGGQFFCRLTAQKSSTPQPGCSCGLHRTNRIVNGQETGINEYPSMAGLVESGISTIYCGGVIIDKRYILTAAHCLINKNPQNLAVIVGEHDVTSNESPATQGIRVSSYRTHPLYSDSNYDYDVGIVTLANDIAFSALVGPVCLPFKYANADFSGQVVTALGWGTLFPGGPSSNTLQKVNLDVISQSSCANAVSSLTNRQICTYTAGKDACQYDSGGPLLFTEPSSGRLYSVGIISSGKFCASGSPGVNSRVTQLLGWIQANTQAIYCNI